MTEISVLWPIPGLGFTGCGCFGLPGFRGLGLRVSGFYERELRSTWRSLGTYPSLHRLGADHV